MLYTGSYANANWKLGIAWSKSLFGPWNRPSSPTIVPSPNSWDRDRLVRGAIHYHQGKYYMPYTGSDGAKYRGGMATAVPYAPDPLITFETRTSPDGIYWEGWKPVANGSPIPSTPHRYFQYRGTFRLSSSGQSPTLTSVTINYRTTQPEVWIPIVVLSTPAFDATTVDPNKITYGGIPPARSSIIDINGDGKMDLLLGFHP